MKKGMIYAAIVAVGTSMYFTENSIGMENVSSELINNEWKRSFTELLNSQNSELEFLLPQFYDLFQVLGLDEEGAKVADEMMETSSTNDDIARHLTILCKHDTGAYDTLRQYVQEIPQTMIDAWRCSYTVTRAKVYAQAVFGKEYVKLVKEWGPGIYEFFRQFLQLTDEIEKKENKNSFGIPNSYADSNAQNALSIFPRVYTSCTGVGDYAAVGDADKVLREFNAIDDGDERSGLIKEVIEEFRNGKDRKKIGEKEYSICVQLTLGKFKEGLPEFRAPLKNTSDKPEQYEKRLEDEKTAYKLKCDRELKCLYQKSVELFEKYTNGVYSSQVAWWAKYWNLKLESMADLPYLTEAIKEKLITLKQIATPGDLNSLKELKLVEPKVLSPNGETAKNYLKLMDLFDAYIDNGRQTEDLDKIYEVFQKVLINMFLNETEKRQLFDEIMSGEDVFESFESKVTSAECVGFTPETAKELIKEAGVMKSMIEYLLSKVKSVNAKAIPAFFPKIEQNALERIKMQLRYWLDMKYDDGWDINDAVYRISNLKSCGLERQVVLHRLAEAKAAYSPAILKLLLNSFCPGDSVTTDTVVTLLHSDCENLSRLVAKPHIFVSAKIIGDVISSQPQPGNEQERKMAENLSRRAEWMRECFDPYYEDMTPGLHALEVKMREFQEKFVKEDNLEDQVVMESFNEMNGFFESLLKDEAEKKSLAAVVQYQNFGETCDVIIKDKLKGDGNIGEENNAKKIIETKLGEIHKGLSDNPYFLESFSEYLRWKHFVKNLSHESSEMLYALYMIMNEIEKSENIKDHYKKLLKLFQKNKNEPLDYRILRVANVALSKLKNKLQ